MGPPPRSLLPMRITASWFGFLARRIQGRGTILRAPTRSSPRTSSSRPRTKCAVVLEALKDEPLRVALSRHPWPLLRAPAPLDHVVGM